MWGKVTVRVWVAVTDKVWGTVSLWVTATVRIWGTVRVWVTAMFTVRVRVRIRLFGILSGYRFNNDISAIQLTPWKSAGNREPFENASK